MRASRSTRPARPLRVRSTRLPRIGVPVLRPRIDGRPATGRAASTMGGSVAGDPPRHTHTSPPQGPGQHRRPSRRVRGSCGGVASSGPPHHRPQVPSVYSTGVSVDGHPDGEPSQTPRPRPHRQTAPSLAISSWPHPHRAFDAPRPTLRRQGGAPPILTAHHRARASSTAPSTSPVTRPQVSSPGGTDGRDGHHRPRSRATVPAGGGRWLPWVLKHSPPTVDDAQTPVHRVLVRSITISSPIPPCRNSVEQWESGTYQVRPGLHLLATRPQPGTSASPKRRRPVVAACRSQTRSRPAGRRRSPPHAVRGSRQTRPPATSSTTGPARPPTAARPRVGVRLASTARGPVAGGGQHDPAGGGRGEQPPARNPEVSPTTTTGSATPRPPGPCRRAPHWP